MTDPESADQHPIAPGSTRADVVVIGGGVMGCSIARELALRGRQVVVVDRGPGVGTGSTSSSSAIIRFHYSTMDAVKLAWEAAQLWERWPEHLGVADELGFARYIKTGMLLIDPPSIDHGAVFRAFDAIGIPYEKLSATELQARFPMFETGRFFPPKRPDDPHFWADPDGEVHGVLTPEGGFVDDPVLAAHNLMTAALAAGATFRFRTEVVAIEQSDGAVSGVRLADGSVLSAPVVVNAAGPHSAIVNAMAGVLGDMTIRTRPLRTEVHSVPSPDGYALEDGAVSVGDLDLGTYFRPHLARTMIVGGIEPDCDPLIWVDDPDTNEPTPTVEVWEAQTLRLARRLPTVGLPSRPVGLSALYDVSDDWVPIYDRSSLPGFFMAIGTSGNQFKNAPMVGLLLAALIEASDAGHDHDREPVQVTGPVTGNQIDLGHFSRKRSKNATTGTVLG